MIDPPKALRSLKLSKAPGYFHYNRAVGVISSVLLEFYRRRVAPYEDVKIKEHGDI